MMFVYYKMNWYMQWMLAEHWDSAFRAKALTCPAPGASGCYCLLALSCSEHWARPEGISDLVQKASLLTRSRQPPKRRWCRSAEPGYSASLGNNSEGSSSFTVTSFFILLQSPFPFAWSYCLPSHTSAVPGKVLKHLTYNLLPQSLFPRPYNLTVNIIKEVFFFVAN